jgi:hypothetical protein
MEAKDAATATAQAATILVQGMKHTKAPPYSLVKGLSDLSARMEAKEAATAAAQAATILVQGMKHTKDPNALLSMAQDLPELVGRMEARDAATAIAQAATTLVHARKNAKDPEANRAIPEFHKALASWMSRIARLASGSYVLQPRRVPSSLRLAQSLSDVLSTVPSADISSHSATAAFAVAFPVGNGYPLTALAFLISAAESPSCPLSTQEFVELLKMPTCIGEVRRIILNHLGTRYRRIFADQWDFVRFAQEQKPGLDLLTPPQRPESPTTER